MKKIIKRFWGVAFIVALLSTLFVGAVPQASAGDLYFSAATLPSSAVVGITANSTEIYQFVVGNDNLTIYAATSNGALKSIDGGRTWKTLTALGFADYDDATNDVQSPADSLNSHLQVAVAPDDVNYVAYMVQTDYAGGILTGNVSVSTDGGTSFHNLGRPKDGENNFAYAVYDLAVSAVAQVAIAPAGGGYVTDHVVAVAGSSDGGSKAALYYCLPSSMGDGYWKNACKNSNANTPIRGTGFTGTQDKFIAVEFSPNFALDDIAYLVATSNAATVNAWLDVVSFNNAAFNAGISTFGGYAQAGMPLGFTDPNTYTLIGPPVSFTGNITRAQIAFSSAYNGLDETSRLAYISIAAGHNEGFNSGGVWRVTDSGLIPGGNIPMFVALGYGTLPSWAISSIALSTDGSKLIAASMEDNRVWTITSPFAGMYSAAASNNPMKRIGVDSTAAADNQTVAFAGANLLDAKQGTEGAFSLSIDNGYTFNDISLVRTTLVTIEDQVIAPDGGQRYIVSNDAGHTSVFFWDSTYWERHLTLNSAHSYVAKASPTNFDILYLGDKSNCNVYYTASAGAVNWKGPTAPRLGSTLADLEVESDSKVYVATNINNIGYVSTLTNTATIWHVATQPTFFAVSASDTLASLTLVSASNVIAGSTQGRIAWSTAADVVTSTWSCSAQMAYGGNTYADAVSLGAYNYIYTVFQNYHGIWGWMVSFTTSWGIFALDWQLDVSSTQTMRGIIIYPHTATGAVYAISTNGTPASYLYRAFMPAYGAADSEWAATAIAPSPTYTAVPGQAPDVLKASAGNQIWFIDTYGVYTGNTYLDRIITYTDIIYAQAPAPVSPVEKYLIQVNKQTGTAYDVTLIWTNVASSYYIGGYQLQVAKDKDFTVLVLNQDDAGTINTAYSQYHQIIGPHQLAPWLLQYQPGETYYWRVRVSSPLYSKWSSTYTLEVQPAPPPVPDLLSPANGGTVTALQPGFSWSAMSGEATASGITMTYTFQLATDSSFSTSSMVYTKNDITTAGINLPVKLTDGKQYFWRVCTTTSVTGDWSTVANFNVSLAAAPTTPVTITQTNVTITQSNPPPTSLTLTSTTDTVNPVYIWVIIIIGAVLVIAIIVLIVRTRRVG